MKLFKKLSIVVALAAVIPAYADEYKDTLNILREKNVITQKEYESKLKAYEEREENKKFIEQRIDKDVSESVKYRQARANDGSVTENGIGLKSKDGNNTIQFTGRLHMDYRNYTPNYGVGQTTDSYQNLKRMKKEKKTRSLQNKGSTKMLAIQSNIDKQEQTMVQSQKMELDLNQKMVTTPFNLQVEFIWTIDTTRQIMVSVKPQIRTKT